MDSLIRLIHGLIDGLICGLINTPKGQRDDGGRL